MSKYPEYENYVQGQERAQSLLRKQSEVGCTNIEIGELFDRAVKMERALLSLREYLYDITQNPRSGTCDEEGCIEAINEALFSEEE